MRLFFISIRGALTQSHPRYYVTANQSKRGVFGIRRPLVGGHAVSAGGFTRTADMALKSGSNTQVIPCPAVLSFLLLRMRATETNSSICEVASLDCFGPASAF